MRELSRFRELFMGRFTAQEAAALLERHGGNANDAAAFVLAAEPAEVRRIIEEENAAWELVGKCERVRTSVPVLEQVRSGRIQTDARLFACGPCDSVWWSRIPSRKPVSKCRRCRRRVDAIARDREWGWASFRCPQCQREFGGFCGIWVPSPCFTCGFVVLPYVIKPPNKERGDGGGGFGGGGGRGGGGPHQLRHRCDAPNCSGRPQGRDRGHPIHFARPDGLPMTCVHPQTRRALGQPLVVIPSNPHDSTGSTVATFLSQEDLLLEYETVLQLPAIGEEDD